MLKNWESIWDLICKSAKKGIVLFRIVFVLALFFLLSPSKVSSQETRFGVKAGLNYSSIVGDLTDGIKFRLSGHGGVFLEIKFSEKFALQPELLYSSQGFRFSSDLFAIGGNDPTTDGNRFRTNVQLNYLTVPLLAKFGLSERYSVDFGPQFGFLINQVTKIKNLDEPDDSPSNGRSTISGNFQSDYGIAVGLGIRMNEQFSVSPRFYLGLRNRLSGTEGNLQNYNVAIQVSVNYIIP